MAIKINFSGNKMINVLGVMTGTSCDGADLALLELSTKQASYADLNIIATKFYDYPAQLKQRLQKMIETQNCELSKLSELNRDLTVFISSVINEFKREHSIDLIGLHGQTIYHLPPKKERLGHSWQLMSHEMVSKLTGVPTVGDFRNGDMALGGHGAPIVPYFDYLMFYKPKTSQLILNIGGIANGTFLPKSGDEKKILAGDFGPGNTLIDGACQRLLNLPYDEDGKIAMTGKVNTSLIITWIMQTKFFHEPFPKSTGREVFSADMLEKMLEDCKRKELSNADTIATISALTISVVKGQFQDNADEVMITGGGARNKFLRKLVENELGPIIYTDPQMRDFKEAIIFALLAYHYITGKPSTFPNTTGIKTPTVLGSLSLP